MNQAITIDAVLNNQKFVDEYRRAKPAIRSAALMVGNVVAQIMLENKCGAPFIGCLSFPEVRALIGRGPAEFIRYPDQLGFVDFASIIREYNGLHVFHGATETQSVFWFIHEGSLTPTVDLDISRVGAVYSATTLQTALVDLDDHHCRQIPEDEEAEEDEDDDASTRKPAVTMQLVQAVGGVSAAGAIDAYLEQGRILNAEIDADAKRVLDFVIGGELNPAINFWGAIDELSTMSQGMLTHDYAIHEMQILFLRAVDELLPYKTRPGYKIVKSRVKGKVLNNENTFVYEMKYSPAPVGDADMAKLVDAAFYLAINLKSESCTLGAIVEKAGLNLELYSNLRQALNAALVNEVRDGWGVIPSLDTVQKAQHHISRTRAVKRSYNGSLYHFVAIDAGPRLTRAQVKLVMNAMFDAAETKRKAQPKSKRHQLIEIDALKIARAVLIGIDPLEVWPSDEVIGDQVHAASTYEARDYHMFNATKSRSKSEGEPAVRMFAYDAEEDADEDWDGE